MKYHKTLLIGGSENPSRYSNMAIRALRKNDVEVIALAKRVGKVLDVDIQIVFPKKENIHTVTMYIGQQRQPEYYNQILDLNPNRVIFNPGAENYKFAEMLENKGVETIEGCTLVMLSTGQY